MYFFITALLSVSVFSQVILSTAQTLPNLERKTIVTDHFRIVYPKPLSEKARIVASALERAFEPLQESLSIDKDFEKIDIILQNQSALSNGYVALAPFRSEWETLPIMSNSLGSTEWLLTLAIHEQRHMHQFLKYRKGFAKFMYYLFGDTGKQVSIFLSAPRWLLEGDAVYEETLFTKSGRGRVANFSKQFRALIKDNKKADYSRVFYGSYEELMPGPYELGYFINLNIRLNYSNNKFELIFDNMVRQSWYPYKLEKEILYYADKDIDSFYDESIEYGLGQYENRETKYSYVDKPSEYFSNKLSLNKYKGGYVYYKAGFYETGGFFIGDINFLNEESLIRTNYSGQNRFKVIGDKFAYSDITIHPRYALVNYSNVYIYDIKKRKKVRLTDDGQFFLPEISPDSSHVASIYFDKSMNQFLKIMDLKGNTYKSIEIDKQTTIKVLAWNNNDEVLISGIDSSATQFIKKVDLESKRISTVYQVDTGVINDLISTDGAIYFSSDKDGIDQIYRLDGGTVNQLTDAAVGARYPYPFGDSVLFSNYTSNGYRVSKTDKNQSIISKKIPHTIDQTKNSSRKDLSDYKVQNFKEESYDKKDFRVHSWSYFSSILSQYNGIASVTSSDNLNQLNITTGIKTNYKEGALSYFLNTSYQKYWPILFLNTEIGKRSVVVIDEEERDTYDSVKWDQDTIELGFVLPLSKLVNAKNYSFTLTNAMTYNNIENKEYPEDEFSGELRGSMHQLSFRYNWLKPYARIFPKYLFTIDSEFRESRTNSGKTSNAYLKYIGSNLALPGGFNSASFLLKYDHQEKSVDRFNFEDRAFFARGYDSYTFTRTDTGSLNYTFSLFYPDYDFFGLLYFKRIRANLFHDYSVGDKEFIFRSIGLETVFDITPFRFAGVDLGVGLRTSFLESSDEVEVAVYLESISSSF